MEIRFAILEDVPGIIQLLKQVGTVHHRGRPDIFRSTAQKYGPSQVIAMLDSLQTPIFVAADEGKVLGYCFCMLEEYKNDPVINDHTELYIDDLCIDEACRGQGIGKALYYHALEYAKQRNCNSVTLNVWCCNENAMAFYRSLGMQPRKIYMETLLEET